MGVRNARKGSVATQVLCPSCRYPNLGIDIWCERCGGPMESSPAGVAWAGIVPPVATVSEAASVPEAAIWPDPQPSRHAVGNEGNGSAPSPDRLPRKPLITLPRLAMPAMPRLAIPEMHRLSVRSIAWLQLSVPPIAWPRLRLPAFAIPELRAPRVSRLVLVIAAVLAILLIAPLAYVLLPSIRPAAVRPAQGKPKATATNSAQAVAIAGVKAKTGLPYAAARCATSGPCLTVSRETSGQDAAAVLFSTAGTSGRQCVGYVYRTGGRWHFLEAACGLPGQLSPLVGHDATVHVPGNCANVRDQASLNGTVVSCLADGTTVRIDGGPNYADGRLWWHEARGWMAHDFLTGP